jgi:ATP-dependent Lon protease
LDPEQNHSFSDHYLEVDFDLSQVLFITTANVRYDIPLPLLDRMEVIELHGYLRHEKLQIAQQFLLPKQIKEHGLKTEEMDMPRDELGRVVDYYTRESGVRELERIMARICRKVARENSDDHGRHVKIDGKKIEKFLGAPPYKENYVERGKRIGTAVGLAWTSLGGEILNIQASVMKGKGNVQLTGRLGDVMKESAHAAVSFLRSHGDDWGIASDFVAKMDIHFHIPEAATPKDGPSAGITMATALLSAVMEKPVPPDVAMTGEITLRGHVLPIGGLPEKVMAAKRAKISRIYIPADNHADWEELDASLRDGLEVKFVESIEEVWKDIFPAPATRVRPRSSHSDHDSATSTH